MFYIFNREWNPFPTVKKNPFSIEITPKRSLLNERRLITIRIVNKQTKNNFKRFIIFYKSIRLSQLYVPKIIPF